MYSEQHLKRQIFQSARTNKPEVFHETLKKIGGPELAFPYLLKRDPEGRNAIALCFHFASDQVLEAIISTFEDGCDIAQFILKQEYDFNPAFVMAFALAPFSKFRERSLRVVQILINLSLREPSNGSQEQDYKRFVNIQDRLGRTGLHMACHQGAPVELI